MDQTEKIIQKRKDFLHMKVLLQITVKSNVNFQLHSLLPIGHVKAFRFLTRKQSIFFKSRY